MMTFNDILFLVVHAYRAIAVTKKDYRRVVVVAQLAKRSLPTPEVHGSNPVIGEVLLSIVNGQLYGKDENKEKEAGNGPF